jgi:hypothetical protein
LEIFAYQKKTSTKLCSFLIIIPTILNSLKNEESRRLTRSSSKNRIHLREISEWEVLSLINMSSI